jgi:hypothetical protein
VVRAEVASIAKEFQANTARARSKHGYISGEGGRIVCRQCLTPWPCPVWETSEEISHNLSQLEYSDLPHGQREP